MPKGLFAPPGSWRGWRMRNMCWAGRCTGSSQALAADGFDVAPGTLAGALKQIAPLIAPWAEAIAAHGRQAGHVHADETSWQVFEDIEDKDGHRWWRWVFAAPRGAASYRPLSGQGWEELSLDLMADRNPKGQKGKDTSGNRRPCPGVRGGAPGDPRDMAKAGLPESQSPEGATTRPPERRLQPVRPLWRDDEFPAVILRGAGAMPVRH